jgi:hypothetical protein
MGNINIQNKGVLQFGAHILWLYSLHCPWCSYTTGNNLQLKIQTPESIFHNIPLNIHNNKDFQREIIIHLNVSQDREPRLLGREVCQISLSTRIYHGSCSAEDNNKRNTLQIYISDLMHNVGSRIIQYISVSLPNYTAPHPGWQQ